MNFFDNYDISRSSTPPTAAERQPTLNEEVTEVMGQLGRFWGGFRKQSQTYLETARKDLGSVVVQAQKELSKLAVVEPAQSQNTNPEATPDGEPSSSDITEQVASTSTQSEEAVPTSPTQTFFSRLQSSIPPNLVATVQNHLPEPLKNAQTNVDFAQFRASLSSEFQRVQGLTLVQAEEYVHKSEELFKEAVKEASVFLKDAVKVVPPEEAEEGSGYSGLVWDGSDVWMLPSTSATPTGKGKGKERAVGGRISEEQRAVATRAQAMLRSLRHDPEVIRIDPEGDERVKELFVTWNQAEIAEKEGGIGHPDWKAKVSEALQGQDGDAIKATLDAVVPADMTEDVFWTRYFFRVYQIEHEEEKRKAVLQGSIEHDEEFSWEDDDDEPGSPTPANASRSTLLQPPLDDIKPPVASELLLPPTGIITPGQSSPRVSSEDSFDVVSSNVSASGDGKPVVKKEEEEEEDDEEEEEEEDEEEDEEDSDWE
ncbi:hypothetical protein JAAARDRAFT_58356 [Jaapia argillacea MUCL 33604]|uniref:BSD domain-containing protein n=1 Tax=Jaapia argillacea MUCL 33604 TaxID=933084 RepID=A0A067Q2Q2_9AGAM|nr:hypothetical protein JAAARDRAFT_58356 [Jaapia argillacea MUCL 33604]